MPTRRDYNWRYMPTGHTGKLDITKKSGRGNWHLMPFALNRCCIETARALSTCLPPVCTSQLTLCARHEVLTAVSTKTTISWNVTPCSLIQTHWHFSVSIIGKHPEDESSRFVRNVEAYLIGFSLRHMPYNGSRLMSVRLSVANGSNSRSCYVMAHFLSM